jgi:hypothetical protein
MFGRERTASKGHAYSPEELAEIVRPIAEKHGIARMTLFGSMARWLNYWIGKEPLNLEKIETLN